MAVGPLLDRGDVLPERHCQLHLQEPAPADLEAGHEEERAGHDHGSFPVIQYVGRDSVLQGVEVHGDVHFGDRWYADFGLDYVRGSLKDTSEALPRIPPLRGRLGLRYQVNALSVGGEATAVSTQDRTYGAETQTDGYALLRLHASDSFKTGRATSTISARAENVTNQLYRNHLSYVKDVVPEMGRTFKLVYRAEF